MEAHSSQVIPGAGREGKGINDATGLVCTARSNECPRKQRYFLRSNIRLDYSVDIVVTLVRSIIILILQVLCTSTNTKDDDISDVMIFSCFMLHASCLSCRVLDEERGIKVKRAFDRRSHWLDIGRCHVLGYGRLQARSHHPLLLLTNQCAVPTSTPYLPNLISLTCYSYGVRSTRVIRSGTIGTLGRYYFV